MQPGLTDSEDAHPEEIVGLGFHFLPPDRQAEVDLVLRALQEDSRFEFMLAVFDVSFHDRPLGRAALPTRSLLRKLLQALDQPDGVSMLYTSPYNDLGERRADHPPRVEWWDFDLADRLCSFSNLRSVWAFLQHGTGVKQGRQTRDAQHLHDTLLHGLVGNSPSFAVWGCADIQLPGTCGATRPSDAGGVWPATEVSNWFHGVFWDDVLFIINPPESTFIVLAMTSG